jgi:hypothetical protein
LNVASLRKFLKKVGHDELVKLFPRLESNGWGSAVGVAAEGSAVAAAAAPVDVRSVRVACVGSVGEVEEGCARG